MQNPNTTIRPKRKMTRKGSIIKFSILGAIVLIIALLSVISFDVPFISNGIYKFNSFASSINIGTDLKSGAYAVFEAKEVQNDEEVSNLPQRINETRDRFYTMLSDRGYPDANVSIEGITRIRAEVPDANDPSTIFQLVDKAAKLIVRAESDSDEKGDLVLGEKHLEKAWVRQTQGQYSVNVKFNKEGSAILSRLTNKGTATVVTRVEGQEDATVSLNNHISNGELSLSGSWANRSDAQNLVVQIMSGSFSTPMTILENDIITPTLGDIALPLAMLAGLLGVVAVMVYLCVVYKLLGVVASASILLFSVLMMFFLYFVPWLQLSLPSIAGIILTILMSVDANIVVFERIKEEYRQGKSINASVNAGFRRGVVCIADANIVSFLVAASMLIFGTGFVQSFGIVMLIGILTTMFSAVFMSNKMLKWVMAMTGEQPSKFGLTRPDGVVEIADKPDDSGKPEKGDLVFDGVV